jgi:radical SAM protein with 4Fe4S-binding SPASM domain
MTVLPWNFEEINDMMEFASAEGVTGFTLYFLVCTGRGERLSDISPQQYEGALVTLVEAQPRYPNMMVRARCAPQITRLAFQRESELVGNAGCLAGRQYCRITPEGDVTPCPYLPPVAGNVRERSFDDIWRDAGVLQRLRLENSEGRCGRCDYQELCGGCRARAFALTGKLSSEDPWCEYQPVEFVSTKQQGGLIWNPEAEQRLQRIPPFVRERVKVAVERYADRNRKKEITPADMTATLESLGRRIPFRRPGAAGGADTLQGPGERS